MITTNQYTGTAAPSTNTDFEVRSLDADTPKTKDVEPLYVYFKYLVMGVIFGIILVKSEVISWFRIQEMFKLQSFHMYGVIGSAILVGIISVAIIKKFNVKTIHGEKISLPDKTFNKGQIYGGLIFGLGWAMTGACPGPLYALLGTGISIIAVVILSALVGTWVYGKYRESLPH